MPAARIAASFRNPKVAPRAAIGRFDTSPHRRGMFAFVHSFSSTFGSFLTESRRSRSRHWLREAALLRYNDRPSERGRCGGRGRPWRSTMSTEIKTKSAASRIPWNKGHIVGQKRPLRPKEVWAIRVRL